MFALRILGMMSVLCLITSCGPDGLSQNILKAQSNKQIHMLDNKPVYIVVMRSGRPDQFAAAHGAIPVTIYSHALRGFAAPLSEQAASALRRNPNVHYVQLDQRVNAIAQQIPTGVDRMDTEMNLGLSGSGITVDADVAVIDSGVYAHTDLNVVQRTNCAQRGPKNRVCTNGAGNDGYGHGTHVAGSIAAKDNGLGVVGVAPGARIWSVRVLDDSGSGWTSWIVAGIDYVAARADEIEVANMSLGGSGSDDGNCGYSNGDAMHTAICSAVAKGIVFVVAAGNETDDAQYHVPAAYDEAITVSALADFDGKSGGVADLNLNCRADVEEDDSLAFFSNFGHDVDIMAPGYCIYSTSNTGAYETMSGTSMASPHVAGLAAQYVVHNGLQIANATDVYGVRDALISSGISQNDSQCGLSTFDDPDGFAEPLAFANAINVGGNGICETPTLCTQDSDCNDGDLCNGQETCVLATGQCSAGTLINCNDNDACSIDTCIPSTGQCDYSVVSCSDGDICTVDFCDSVVGCDATPVACDNGTDGCCSPGCDGVDPDCDVQACGLKNTPCTLGSDCCSGQCHPRKRTCK